MLDDRRADPGGQAALSRAVGGVEQRGAVYALDVLHEHRRPLADLGERVDLHDVIVVELGHQPRLVPGPGGELAVAGELLMQELHGHPLHEAFGAVHVREVDRAEAAFAERLEQTNLAAVRVLKLNLHGAHPGAQLRPP